jgi:hypothetical protein
LANDLRGVAFECAETLDIARKFHRPAPLLNVH